MTASTIRPHDDYFVVDSPYEVARWRPLVHWLMFVPHALILQAFRALAGVIAFVYWVALIVTGRLHRGLYDVMAMYERYSARATAFLFGFTEQYAPFAFHGGGDDDRAYPPVTLTLPEPQDGQVSRKLAFNFLLAIPHYLVFVLYAVAAVVVAIGAWFAVLFTGEWPEGWRRFLVRVNNYYYRIWSYATMVETTYPKFGLA